MFIVSLTYKTDLSEADKHFDAHIAFIEKYYSLGKIISSGKKVPRTGGVILMRASSKEEVETIIKEDPFYFEGVADFDIIEFLPTRAAKGFESLINS